MQIDTNNYKDFLKGASLFTTGGGIPLADQYKTLKSIEKNLLVPVLPVDTISLDAYISVVAELGPTDVPPIKKKKVIKKMLHMLTLITGKKISGLYEPELGQESVLLESAHLLQLPIIDIDLVGSRAVPCVDINIFRLKNIPFSYAPMIVCTDRGDIFVIETEMSDAKLEQTLRKMTSLSQTHALFVMGGVVSLKTLVKNDITKQVLSKAVTYGKVTTQQALFKKFNAKFILSGKVHSIKEVEKDGFFAQEIVLMDKDDKRYTLIVLNEVLFMLDNKKNIRYAVPDRILLLEERKTQGLSATQIREQMEITVVVVDPEKEWQGNKAKKIFGKERFSYLLP